MINSQYSTVDNLRMNIDTLIVEHFSSPVDCSFERNIEQFF